MKPWLCSLLTMIRQVFSSTPEEEPPLEPAPVVEPIMEPEPRFLLPETIELYRQLLRENTTRVNELRSKAEVKAADLLNEAIKLEKQAADEENLEGNEAVRELAKREAKKLRQLAKDKQQEAACIRDPEMWEKASLLHLGEGFNPLYWKNFLYWRELIPATKWAVIEANRWEQMLILKDGEILCTEKCSNDTKKRVLIYYRDMHFICQLWTERGETYIMWISSSVEQMTDKELKIIKERG